MHKMFFSVLSRSNLVSTTVSHCNVATKKCCLGLQVMYNASGHEMAQHALSMYSDVMPLINNYIELQKNGIRTLTTGVQPRGSRRVHVGATGGALSVGGDDDDEDVPLKKFKK